MTKQQKQIDKEFKLSSWAIANKTTIFVMISLILFLGISAYYSMPRESFPEIKEGGTPGPGTVNCPVK